MSWNFWHRSVSDIDHRQTSVCCACSRYGRFFLPHHWLLFFGRKYREKIVKHMVQTKAFSPLPHLLHRKDSPAPAALAAGAGHYFLHFHIQPHPFIPLIMVRTKMSSLETFQSNITKTSAKRYVDCNAVSWFSNKT